MSENQPRCSIVIRAFNEEKHIGRLLTGIMHQTVDEVEIVLVDSGSSDTTVAIASRYPVKIVHIRPEEFTFGRSLNHGIEQTTSEFVVIASAHVYPVFPDWLEKLLKPFDDPRAALVYGKQRGNESTYYSEQQHFAKLFPAESIAVQQHPFCNNANSAVRRSLWLQNPFDEELTGLEDMAWANWAIQQNYILSYAANAEVVHVHSETPRQIYNRYRREAIALRRIKAEERFHIGDFLRLYLSNVMSDGWHALRERVFLREALGILKYRLMQFWGTYRGFSLSKPLSASMKQVFYYPRGFRAADVKPRRDVEPIDYQRI
jgi:rhamnosyltransferase